MVGDGVDLLDSQVYGHVGDEGFARLVDAFYAQIPADAILGPMYARSNLDDARWRLREFLIGRFGGPERYIQKRGHPRLRMRHNPFIIDQAARDRWIALMSRALDEMQFESNVDGMLRRFFEDSATFMINHP